MVRAYRFCDRRWASSALSGRGAFEYGARWNSKGTTLAHTSGSRALAHLEVRVHAAPNLAPRTHISMAVDIPEDLIMYLDASTLPHDWRRYPAPRDLAKFGDAWVSDGESAVLAVPSAVVPEELNYLINPQHADFKQIVVGTPEPVVYDPRLFVALQRK